MSSFAVTIEKIESIEPHANADRLEIATIKGWKCVVGKGQFTPGDVCVYFPIDSILPETLEQQIFGTDSKITLEKHRVKTIKIRGAISQGLATSLETLGLSSVPQENTNVGSDLTEYLGVTKFEPAPPKNFGLGNVTRVHYNDPNFRKYTSIENFKNYPNLFQSNEGVVVTEKIHGTNFRCGWVPRKLNFWQKLANCFVKDGFKEWEFVYGSHNVQLSDWKNAQNVYADIVRKYDLPSKIRYGDILYGEIYGDGVQANYSYGLKDGQKKLVAFDLARYDGHYFDYVEFLERLHRDIPSVPVVWFGTFDLDEIKKYMSGPSMLCDTQPVKEGLVIKPLKESTDPYVGRRVLKLINDEYLLQKGNTDFH